MIGARADRYYAVYGLEPSPDFPVRDGLACAEIVAFDSLDQAFGFAQRNRPAVVRRGAPDDEWLASNGWRRVGS